MGVLGCTKAREIIGGGGQSAEFVHYLVHCPLHYTNNIGVGSEINIILVPCNSVE